MSCTVVAATSFNGQNISCNGLSDGSASVTPSGGTAPYSYSWTPSAQTSSVAVNLGAGIYTVLVTDVNGCNVSRSVARRVGNECRSRWAADPSLNGQDIS